MPRKISKEIFGNARSVINEQKQKFEEGLQHEREAFKSGSEKGPYFMYDDDLENMEYSFKDLIPWGFKYYLRERFGENQNLVGVELGGPGSNFFGGLSEFFKKSAGVTTLDLRHKYQTEFQKNFDTAINHSIIAGDIFSKKTLAEVDKWLGNQRADFIIERMQAGWNFNTDSLVLFGKYLGDWYKRLSQVGVMFVQTPFASSKPKMVQPGVKADYEAWIKLMRDSYGDFLTINANNYVLSLEKTPKAPEKINTLKF